MDQALAWQQLQALASIPGALKIITNEPNTAVTDAAPNEPRFFVQHDVVEIVGPNTRGQVRAWSANGDYTEGQPSAVLARLQEWQR